jgi:hypothetical protein
MRAIISKPDNYVNSTPHSQFSIIGVNNNNPEYGYIMLRSNTVGISDQGWRVEEKRVGRYVGKVEDLVKDVKTFGLQEGMDFSQKAFPVKLVIKESFEPAYNGHEPKINPTTKETVTSGGAPVYRQTLVVAENAPQQDEFLPTDREEVTAKTQANVAFDQRK